MGLSKTVVHCCIEGLLLPRGIFQPLAASTSVAFVMFLQDFYMNCSRAVHRACSEFGCDQDVGAVKAAQVLLAVTPETIGMLCGDSSSFVPVTQTRMLKGNQ